MAKRHHKCQLCGMRIIDTQEKRIEHFQKFHDQAKKCTCNMCGKEIIDTIEECQKHTLMHIEMKEEIVSPMYTELERSKQYSEANLSKKGGIGKGREKKKNKRAKSDDNELAIKPRAKLLYNAVESKRRRH